MGETVPQTPAVDKQPEPAVTIAKEQACIADWLTQVIQPGDTNPKITQLLQGMKTSQNINARPNDDGTWSIQLPSPNYRTARFTRPTHPLEMSAHDAERLFKALHHDLLKQATDPKLQERINTQLDPFIANPTPLSISVDEEGTVSITPVVEEKAAAA